MTLVDAGDSVGCMSIRYSGVVRQVSVDIATAFEDLGNNREPRSVPLGSGEVVVRPVNVEAPLTGGSFRADVTDEQKFIDGYRLMVSTRPPDPCSQQRVRLRDARKELETSRRDGVSDQALAALEADVAARSRELDACLVEHGLATVSISSTLRVFRSRDLPRTGRGRQDLRVYVRVLDADDREARKDQDIDVPDIITSADLTAQAQASVARRLQPLFDKGGTLTVLGIGLAPGGLRVASALARRRERPPRRRSLLAGLRGRTACVHQTPLSCTRLRRTCPRA